MFNFFIHNYGKIYYDIENKDKNKWKIMLKNKKSQFWEIFFKHEC